MTESNVTEVKVTRDEKNSLSWIDTSKVLGIKWKVFKQYLLDKGYIYITESSKKINCYDKYSTKGGNGLFYKKIDIVTLPDGTKRKNYQTKVTVKGIEFFKKELRKEGLIK